MKYSQLGNLIKIERENHGWEQAELAAMLGVGQQAVSRWEKGGSRPRQNDLSKLINIFSVDSDEWWYVAGYQPEEPDQSLAPFLPVGTIGPEKFELFCRDFIQCLNPEADVSVYGSPGDTQEGIDIYAKTPDSLKDYQCKRHKSFGPADIDKAVKDTTFEADHHYLLLGRTATARARKAILKHKNWTLWDREDISAKVRSLPADEALRIVDTYFPGKRKIFLGREEPSPWLTPMEFFQALVSRQKLFSHGWNFVGRKTDLETLRTFEKKAECQTILICGRGGIGKSRLLREWAESVKKGTAVRFITQRGEVRPQDFDLLPKGFAFLVIDDAHDRSDMPFLLSGIARFRPELKLILSTRSHGLKKLQEDLSQFGITFDRDEVIKLNDLGIDEAEMLAQEILSAFGGEVDYARRIAEITSDCPLATVIGSHLVAKGKLDLNLLGNDDEFRAELMGRFRDVITGQIGYSSAEAERELLNFLAMIQPFNPGRPDFQDAVERALHRPFDSINRDLRAFEDGGVLLRRGDNLRIVPDLLADYIRWEAAYDERNRIPTGYANRIFTVVDNELATNVLINISQIDWKLSNNGAQSLLLNQVWIALLEQFKQAKIFERVAILSMIEKVAYYQPVQALEFVHLALEQPTDEIEDDHKSYTFMDLSYNNVLHKIPGVLRYAAYQYEYLPEVLDILKQLAETDSRPANQFPDHPIRVLQDIASIEPGKPLFYNELVANHVIGWLEQPSTANFSPFDVLDQLLQTEGHQSESKGYTITFKPFQVRPEVVTELRKQIIDVTVAIIKTKPLKEALRAIKTLGTGLQLPMGLFGHSVSQEDKQAWEPNLLYVFNRLEELVSDPQLDPYIAADIRGMVTWHFVFSKRSTKAAAGKVLQAIPTTLPYEISRAIADRWGRTFESEQHPTRDAAALIEWQKNLAQRILETYGANYLDLIQMLEERVNTLSKAQTKDGVDIGPFLANLLEASPQLALALGEYILSRPQPPLSDWFNVVIVVASKQDRALALQMINAGMAKEDRIITFGIANALSWGLHNLPIEDEEIRVIREVVLSPDPWLRRTITRSIKRFPLEKKSQALQILLSINIADSPEVADEVLGEFNEQYGSFKISDLTAKQIENLLAQLMTCPAIKEYQVEIFLKEVSLAYPFLALQFLINRIEFRAANPNRSDYEPLPLSRGEESQLRFHETPQYEQILRAVRNWCFEKTGNWVFTYFGPRLFKMVSAGFDGTTLKILEEWILSADTHQLEAVASLLREASPSFIWENQPFIVNLLNQAQRYGTTCYKRVSGSLYLTVVQGERHGPVGQPFPQDIELKERSYEMMGKMPIGSPAHRFYKLLFETSVKEISRRENEGLDSD